MNLQKIKDHFPEYSDMKLEEFFEYMHKKYYSHMKITEMYQALLKLTEIAKKEEVHEEPKKAEEVKPEMEPKKDTPDIAELKEKVEMLMQKIEAITLKLEKEEKPEKEEKEVEPVKKEDIKKQADEEAETKPITHQETMQLVKDKKLPPTALKPYIEQKPKKEAYKEDHILYAIDELRNVLLTAFSKQPTTDNADVLEDIGDIGRKIDALTQAIKNKPAAKPCYYEHIPEYDEASRICKITSIPKG